MNHRSPPTRHSDPARGAMRPGERREPRWHEPSWPGGRRWSADTRYTSEDREGYPGVGMYEGVGGYPGGGQVGPEGYRGGAGYQSGGSDFLHGEDYEDWGERGAGFPPRGGEHPRRFAASPSGYRPGREEPGARWQPVARGFGEGDAYRPTPEEDPGHVLYGRVGGHRGKGPKGYTRSDERIREDLSERLAEDDEIDPSDVSVEVREGVVTLEGSVEQRWMRHRIEDMADACRGVRDVVNHLRVAGTSQGVAGG